MRRTEALGLVGCAVRAWTSANGVYVGIVEAIHGSPWRARVRVTSVIEPACHFEGGRLCRRGFRPGEILDVGGASVQPLVADEGEVCDYMAALLRRRQLWEAQARPPAQAAGGRNDWVRPTMMLALDAAVAAEGRRLRGEPWQLSWLRSLAGKTDSP